MIQDIDLNYLKYFYYVSKEGGFTKAAQTLHVQQPVVSRAVKLLEEQLGFKLFERQKKNILHTAEGEKIFKYCEEIFKTTKTISEFVQEKENSQTKIAIATTDSLSAAFAETVLGQLKKEYPRLAIYHFSGSASTFTHEIENGLIDMGFFFFVTDLPNTLSKMKVANVDFHYVIKKTALKNETNIHSFIASYSHEKSAQDLPLFKKYKNYDSNAFIDFVSASTLTRKAAVLQGLGVTVLPSFLIKKEIQNKLLSCLYSPEKLALYIVERKSSYRSKLKNSIITKIAAIVNS